MSSTHAIRGLAAGLVLLAAAARPQSPKFEFRKLRVETVVDNGSPRNHVDVVIVGDGYVEEDLRPGGLYEQDVARTHAALFELEPFHSYADAFNLYAVYAESFDRGAGDRRGDEERATIFGCSFDAPDGRLLTYQRPENVIRAAKNAPAADIVLVIVNDPRYGGAGGVIWDNKPAPCFSNSPESLQIAIHELGHSFAGLGDEYADPNEAAGRPLPGGTQDLPHPNLTLARFVDTTSPETIAKTAKWKHFFEVSGAERVISAHEGGYYRATGVFRPEERCKMRSNAEPFCHVCREELAKAIHEVSGRRFKDREYHERNPIADGK